LYFLAVCRISTIHRGLRISRSGLICYPFATREQIIDPLRRVLVRAGQKVSMDLERHGRVGVL
jgi:hypothetical protein